MPNPVNRSEDLAPTREELRQQLMAAFESADPNQTYEAFSAMADNIAQDVLRRYEAEQSLEGDERALAARGHRILTASERKFYTDFTAAMRSADPQQALSNGNIVLPSTTIDEVFAELQSAHPLLSHINFRPTGGATKMIMALNPYQMAHWGPLCAEAVTEITAGFVEVETGPYSLTAFIPVCRAMLALGPVWLDEFVRQVLYEALSNGLEWAYITGTGADMPIGMDRQVGDNVAVVGGVHPRKKAIPITDLTPGTVGPLLGQLAIDPSGKSRIARQVIFICNPVDSYSRVFPAITVQGADGEYRRNISPVPMEFIESPAVPIGEAIIGLGYRYLATVGQSMGPEGQISYSDHAAFLQRQRIYLAEWIGNGYPMDNNAFLLLDINGLKPAAVPTAQVTPAAGPSADATLKTLQIQGATLSPQFDPNTAIYSTEVSSATATVTAAANGTGATVVIKNGSETVTSGQSGNFKAGENLLTITVTAKNAINSRTYIVRANYKGG